MISNLTRVSFSVEFVVGQLLDLQSTQTPRFRLAQSLGQAQQRLVVLRLVRVWRVGLGLTVWRQRKHGSVKHKLQIPSKQHRNSQNSQEIQQDSGVSGRRLQWQRRLVRNMCLDLACVQVRWSVRRWRPVEAREVPPSGRDATRRAMQQLHLIGPALGRDEDGLRWRDLRHLCRVEMREWRHVIDGVQVEATLWKGREG
jgi:hypothetical protein